MKTLFTLTTSPLPPHFAELYRDLDIAAEHFDSARKLHRALQKQAPDFFLGEFVYGWGNDYAGNTVSNLDVSLRTLQCKAPKAKLIVLMQPSQAPHIGKLLELFPVHAVLRFPLGDEEMRAVLQSPA